MITTYYTFLLSFLAAIVSIFVYFKTDKKIKKLKLFWKHLKDVTKNNENPFNTGFIKFFWNIKILNKWEAVEVNTKQVKENISLTTRVALFLIEKDFKKKYINIKYFKIFPTFFSTTTTKRSLKQFIRIRKELYGMEGFFRIFIYIPQEDTCTQQLFEEMSFKHSIHINHALNYELNNTYYILYKKIGIYE